MKLTQDTELTSVRQINFRGKKDLPQPGIEPRSPAWTDGHHTTRPIDFDWSSGMIYIYIYIVCFMRSLVVSISVSMFSRCTRCHIGIPRPA